MQESMISSLFIIKLIKVIIKLIKVIIKLIKVIIKLIKEDNCKSVTSKDNAHSGTS